MLKEENIQQQLTRLREEFRSSLITRIDQVVANLSTLSDRPDTKAGFATVFRQIHTLAGSAGTFGFLRLSVQSRQLELILKPMLDSGELPDKKFVDHLRSGLHKLIRLAEQGPEDSVPEPLPPAAGRQAMERLLYLVASSAAPGLFCHTNSLPFDRMGSGDSDKDAAAG